MNSRLHVYVLYLSCCIGLFPDTHVSGCILSLEYNTTRVEEGGLFTITCSFTPECDLQTHVVQYNRWNTLINPHGDGGWIEVAGFSSSSNYITSYQDPYGIYSRATGWFSGPLSHSLTVTHVTLYDGEEWMCRFNDKSFPFFSNRLDLVVTVTPIPSDIIVTRQKIGPVFADSSETFTCFVSRVFPEAYVAWNINGETINGSGVLTEIGDSSYIVYRINDTLIYNVTYGQIYLSVTCTVYTSGNKTVEPDDGLDFEVSAALKGTPTLTLSTTTFRIGAQSALNCTLDTAGYNSQTTTTFYINDTIIGESLDTELLFTPSAIFGQNLVVWCKKHNGVGESLPSNTVEIKVKAPSTLEYISTNATGFHDIRKGFSLVCIAAGTNANITWKFHDGVLPDHVFHVQENTEIKGMFSYGQQTAVRSEIHSKTSDEFDFACEDIAELEQNIYCEIGDVEMSFKSTIVSNPINITLLHHPILTDDHSIHQIAELGEHKYLTCDVCANPPVESLEWYWNNQPIREKLLKFPNGTLNIGSVAEDDYGTYTCVVKNGIGVRRFAFVLTRAVIDATTASTSRSIDNQYFIGLIAASGVAAVAIIVCALLAVILCRKTSVHHSETLTGQLEAAENKQTCSMNQHEAIDEREYADIEHVPTYDSTKDVPGDDYVQSYATLKK